MKTAQLNSETLRSPIQIAPNLAAGVLVNGHWITVEYSDRPGDSGRTRYKWSLLFPADGPDDITGDDLQSGCWGGNLSAALASLLSFLGAAAESRQHHERRGGADIDPDSNEGLFPPAVVDFAAQHSDEIACLLCEIEGE